jgi:amino acid transporter
MSPEDGPKAPELRRTMNGRDVVLFLVAAVVGLRWIATSAAAGPSGLVIWLIAFLAFFIPLAFTVIALAARYPDEGGLYVWTREAFGDLAGFMSGWMYWTSNLVYFPGLLYFSVGNALYIGHWHSLDNSAPYYIIASLIGLIIAFGLNVVGLGVGKWLHNAGGVGSWLPILILVVMGGVAWARFGSATPFTAASLVPSVSLKEIAFWSTIAFGFSGLESASFMGGEIQDARRTIPRAILTSGVIITAIYVLGTAAILVALPPGQVSGLQGITQAIDSTATRIGLGFLGPLSAILITIGNIGGVGAWLASVARLPFAAGIDRVLPPAFGRLHPRWGTPHVALWVQAVGAGLFVILGQAGTDVKGAYDALVSIGVISYFIPYFIMFAAAMKLVRGPLTIAFGVLGLVVTSGAIALASLPPEGSNDPVLAVVKVVGASVVLFVLGLALFAYGRRRR